MDKDQLNDDLAEVLEDFEQFADFTSADGQTSAYGVPVVSGDVNADASTDPSALREEYAGTLTVRACDLPFRPVAGTTVTFEGRPMRVTSYAATPGDVCFTLTIENRSMGNA